MVERRVLAVDDDPAALEAIVALLQKDGFEVHTAASAEAAEELLSRFSYPLIITDLVLPGQSGIDLVRHAGARQPEAASIVVTGHATLRTAIDALKAGAADYLTKPINPEELRGLIAGALEARSRRPTAKEAPAPGHAELGGMVSRSPAMRAVFEKIELAAQTESTVLLQGESGSGKELCARAIHARSRRSAAGFHVFHAGAVPPERILEDLFGAGQRGGARPAWLDQARGGTLLLEEVDALDPRAQGALLEMLERGAFKAPRGQGEPAELRLIVSTHRELAELVRDGRFREDLFYRLSIFPIELPPLRERREDIPLLVDRFLDTFSARYEKPRPSLPSETLERLIHYEWPGNVRELQNVIEHAVILCTDGLLTPMLLPRMLHGEVTPSESIQIPIGTRMKEIERAVIAKTLDAFHWNKNKTAKILGISRRSLYNKLDRYRITREGAREAFPLREKAESPAAAPAPSLAESKN